jgi:proteasome lid subunit RPN8/RPN11
LKQLDLPEHIMQAIAMEAARALPAEACGVLLGALQADVIQIRSHRPVQNIAGDGVREYAIPGDVVLTMQRAAEREGLDVVGFYHSHPNGPAGPSARDLTGAWPGYVYVIADARTGGVTAWLLREDRHAFEPAD